jgi:hypothetical protein
VSSYESGEIFVVCPQNTSRKKIFEAVRSYAQEKLERPIITLSNYSYQTEKKWRERAEKDREFELAVDDILLDYKPVARVRQNTRTGK